MIIFFRYDSSLRTQISQDDIYPILLMAISLIVQPYSIYFKKENSNNIPKFRKCPNVSKIVNPKIVLAI